MALCWHLATVYTCSSLKSHCVTPKREPEGGGREEYNAGWGITLRWQQHQISSISFFSGTLSHIDFCHTAFPLNTSAPCGNDLGCLLFLLLLETHRARQVQAALCRWNVQTFSLVNYNQLSIIDWVVDERGSSCLSSEDLKNNGWPMRANVTSLLHTGCISIKK